MHVEGRREMTTHCNVTLEKVNTNQLSVNITQHTQQMKLSFAVGVMCMSVQGIKTHCSHKFDTIHKPSCKIKICTCRDNNLYSNIEKIMYEVRASQLAQA